MTLAPLMLELVPGADLNARELGGALQLLLGDGFCCGDVSLLTKFAALAAAKRC